MRLIYTILGIICVTLGTLGLFLPILPTTPFLLLAAWLFIKGSPKLHNWLINHPVYGKFINNYIKHKAIPLHAKVVILLSLWATISISIYIVDMLWLRILLFLVAIAVTIHVSRVKTLKKK